MSLKTPDIPNRFFRLQLSDTATGGNSVLCVGSSRSGKSVALKYILDNYFRKHVGVLFSQSIKANAYKEMNYPLIAKAGIYIPNIIRDMYAINKETDNHYPFLVVIDDCPTVRNDKELLRLATIYRNSAVSSVVCCQNITMLNPTARSNINFILLFKMNNTEAIESVIRTYLRGYFPSGWRMEDKIRFYREITEDYHFIFIDNLNGTICRTKIDL